MSIRCGSCKDYHDSIPQVLSCSATQAGQETCKHHLDTGTCVLCARWNKRRGTVTIRSHIKNPPLWLTEVSLDANSTCSLCKEIIYLAQRITVRKGFKNWAHTECFTDPGEALHQEPQKSQREPDPEYNDLYNRISALQRAADKLIPEAIQVEQETDILCLKQVAQDMDYDLSIDLIRETIYGYDLEQLGAWEPRNESDFIFLEDEDHALYQLQAAYAAL